MNQKYQSKYRIPSSRLSAWDYSSAGWYFVTICVQNRKPMLSDIVDNKVILSTIGEMVMKYWDEIPKQFPHVDNDEYIIMPNHIHGIIVIDNDDRDAIEHGGGITGKSNPMGKQSLGEIIRWFKGRTSYEIHKISSPFQWQPRYYDHVIRNETSLQKIREYIRWNHLKWDADLDNPKNIETR